MEGSPDGRLNAAGKGAVEEPGGDRHAGYLGPLLMVVLASLAIGASAMVLDGYIREGDMRMLSAGILLGVLGLYLAMAAALWSREPQPWKHRFIPQRFQDELHPRLASVFSAEVQPPATMISPERILCATWVREALAERIVMALRLCPADIAVALDRPHESEALEGLPTVRRFLHDTRDLGVAAKGSVLTVPKREFLKAVEAALSEAGSL